MVVIWIAKGLALQKRSLCLVIGSPTRRIVLGMSALVTAKSCEAYRHVGHLVTLVATLVSGHDC